MKLPEYGFTYLAGAVQLLTALVCYCQFNQLNNELNCLVRLCSLAHSSDDNVAV